MADGFVAASNLLGPIVGDFLSSKAKDTATSTNSYLGPRPSILAAVGVLVGPQKASENLKHAEKTRIQRL